jgi:hypothetical protein
MEMLAMPAMLRREMAAFMVCILAGRSCQELVKMIDRVEVQT